MQASNVLFSSKQHKVQEDAEEDDEDVWDDRALIQAYDRAVSLAKQEVNRRMGINGASADEASSVSSSVQDSTRSNEKKDRKKKKKNTAKKNYTKWLVGMPCRAIYSEDFTTYEATIKEIYEENGLCVVEFVGYKNIQDIPIQELLPTEGENARLQQLKDALLQDKVYDEPENKVESSPENMEWSEGGQQKEDSGSGSKSYMNSKARPCHPVPTSLEFFSPDDSMSGASASFMSIPPPPPISQLVGRLPTEDSEVLSSMLMSWYLNGFHTGYYLGLKRGKEDAQKMPHHPTQK